VLFLEANKMKKEAMPPVEDYEIRFPDLATRSTFPVVEEKIWVFPVLGPFIAGLNVF
jgi:hypothetical protein